MAKIKLTKNELKKQKDSLQMFRRYLPTLQLKKQQLQVEIMRIQRELNDLDAKIKSFENEFMHWVDVFAEDIDIKSLLQEKQVHTSLGNIAGVDIPVLEKIDFKWQEYDFMTKPLWIDYGIMAAEKDITLKTNHEVLHRQLVAIQEELRITTQRVNLFEKVKIPESQGNIRKIQIYIGDLQTSAVVIGKIAKEKIQAKNRIQDSGFRIQN